MGTVVNLALYRRKSRKDFLAKHGARIDRVVERFVNDIDVDFRQLAADYQDRYGTGQASWDYVEFREILAEAIDEAFGRALYEQLRAQRWFDNRLITKEEIIERCLSTYVLSQCAYALPRGN
jgi:hypothetical protein